MTETKELVISFRVSPDIISRIEEQANLVPRLPGESGISFHKMAKALMHEGLKARENKKG